MKDLASLRCFNCNSYMTLGVYMSAAGYYIGYFCNKCGPYNRISGYYPSRELAVKDFNYYNSLEMGKQYGR